MCCVTYMGVILILCLTIYVYKYESRVKICRNKIKINTYNRCMNPQRDVNRICFQTADALIEEDTNISIAKRARTCVNVQEYEDTHMPLKPRNMLSSIIVGYATCVRNVTIYV